MYKKLAGCFCVFFFLFHLAVFLFLFLHTIPDGALEFSFALGQVSFALHILRVLGEQGKGETWVVLSFLGG